MKQRVMRRRLLLSALSTALGMPLALSLGLGCADPKPPTDPGRETSAKPAAQPGTAAELAVLTDTDCRKWADHFAARLREATRRRIAECDIRLTAAGGTPIPSDAKDVEITDAEADRLHGLIVDQCGQQAGAAYPKADAQCYLGSKTMEGWQDCHFQSMFFADYKAVAKNHQKMFEDRCRSALDKLAP